ncbi:MAG: pyridoxamine 5'-phosphate oxidase family protein [Pseudomonadota bacterium]
MSQLQEQIRAVFGQAVISALATVTAEGKPWVRYVVVMAQDDLTLRLATYLGSRKVAQIQANPEVHLTAGAEGLENIGKPYVQVQALAAVSTDPELKRTMWNDMLQTYFSGPDDPNYAVVTLSPYRVEYYTFEAMEPQVWEAGRP